MARALKLIFWFLLIGMAINVVMAWGCQFLWAERIFDARTLGRVRAATFAEHERRFEEDPGSVPPPPYVRWAFIAPGSQVLFVDDERLDNVRYSQIIHRLGWPFQSLGGEQRIQIGKPPWFRIAAVEAGQLRLSYPAGTGGGSSFTVSRLLPLQPIWPGFFMNTLIFALGALVIWMLARAAIAIERRLRGRCGHCGYPVGVSDRCSECGRPVTPRQRVPAP